MGPNFIPQEAMGILNCLQWDQGQIHSERALLQFASCSYFQGHAVGLNGSLPLHFSNLPN